MAASPNLAQEAVAGVGAAGEATVQSTGPYVLNLCSSTTPLALAQTELPELKRFTFFVSRRFEEGRERFRLHMGHFSTLAEAEEWLNVVREIYPGAWAGEAPGRRLRERAAATAAAQAQAGHAAGPQGHAPVPPHPPTRASHPALRQAAGAPTGSAQHAALPNIPVLKAAPPQAPRATAAGRGERRAAAPVATAPVARPAARAVAGSTRAAPPARAGRKDTRPIFEDSNVREVLRALGEAGSGDTRVTRAPAPPPPRAAAEMSMTDTQVLRMLEARRSGDSAAEADAAARSVPLLKPDDSGTRRALKEAVVSSAPVAFAVQLQWSVQPAELDKVPPLAIFSAYTLYTVEGSRDGRKWYGLRLGFFSDAISAKQVAHYVRSEFGSVAVVPVSPQEKMRATSEDRQATVQARPGSPRARQDEFKLLDDDAPAAGASAAASPRTARPARSVPGDKPQRRGSSPVRVGAAERRSAQTLEETLEILGASELSMDSGDGLSDSGVRHLQIQQVQRNSPFARLLERLSERTRKG